MSARVYPIAATPSEVFSQANGHADPETSALLAKARPTSDHKIILRVDRVEPTKNIITGFRAFERMLIEHKRLRERVTFVALLVPSREGLPEYRAVMRETQGDDHAHQQTFRDARLAADYRGLRQRPRARAGADA